MKKKIMGIALAVVMLFAVATLAACEIGGNNPTLAEYQATAVTALETYAEGKGQANYTEANWTLLQSHVVAGATNINAATDKAGVRVARDAAKQQIGTVPREANSVGTFFTMQEAYNKNLITRDNVKHIGYFTAGAIFEVGGLISGNNIDFEPQIKTPAISDLDSGIVESMRNSFLELRRQLIEEELNNLISNGSLQAGTTALSTISIVAFLGEFDGAFAVQITSSLWEYGGASYPVNVAGIEWEQFAPEILIFTYQQTK